MPCVLMSPRRAARSHSAAIMRPEGVTPTLSAADLRNRDFRKILLIKLSAVGDVVHTIPVLNKLRRRYPEAQLDWLVTPPIAELLQHHPGITNIIEFEREAWSRPWRLAPFTSYARLAAKLRAAAYDLVIDMHGQFRTAALALATGAPARIGFDRPRARVWDASPRKFPEQARKHAWQGAREGSWLAYTHHIAVPTLDLHAVDRYLNVGSILGLDKDPADFSFPIPQSAKSRVDSLLRQNGVGRAELVTMAPGTIWETKHWGNDKFAQVAHHFIAKGFAVVLIGSRRERAVCEEVAELAPGTVDFAGMTTLSELAALIQRSSISITNDSGPMHLAVALNRPVVSIFGPTDSIWIGPYQRTNAALQADLPCSPCYLRRLEHCGHNHACMHSISALAVIERAESVLNQNEPRLAPATMT
jgi:heptosyltransferase I